MEQGTYFGRKRLRVRKYDACGQHLCERRSRKVNYYRGREGSTLYEIRIYPVGLALHTTENEPIIIVNRADSTSTRE